MIKRTSSTGDGLNQLNTGRGWGGDDAPGSFDAETPEHKRAQRTRSTASPFAWTRAMLTTTASSGAGRDARYLAIVICGLLLGAVLAARLVFASALARGSASSYVDASADAMCGDAPRHVVVVDAGSTGCRAHTFEIVPGAAKPRFELRAIGKKVKGHTPLASLAGVGDDDVAEAIVPMLEQDLHYDDVERWAYFCQISDSTTSYGSYSGAVPNEKITWGKLSASTPKFVIESDATIGAPLLLSALLECKQDPRAADRIINKARKASKQRLARRR